MTPPYLRRRNTRQQRSRRIRESLPSIMPIQIPLQQSVAWRVQLRTLLTSRHLRTVLPTSHIDVETLGPELPFRNRSVVVNGNDFSSKDVVAAGDTAWNRHALAVVIVVEDRIGT